MDVMNNEQLNFLRLALAALLYQSIVCGSSRIAWTLFVIKSHYTKLLILSMNQIHSIFAKAIFAKNKYFKG